MLDPIRYAQHLSGGEIMIQIQIDKEKAKDTEMDEAESHKKNLNAQMSIQIEQMEGKKGPKVSN